MKRRTLLGGLAAGLVAAPLAGLAQPAARVLRVGVLAPASPSPSGPVGFYAQFLLKMRDLGFVEGKNLAVDWRYAQGKPERLPGLAKELVQRKVDVIVAVAASSVRAARQATTTIPIVMYGNFDPVAEGFATSLARPGGNLTGVLISSEGTLGAKRLELLKEAVPQAAHIAFLTPADAGATARQFQEVEQAATALGVKVTSVRAKDTEYGKAFGAITAMRADAVYVAASTIFVRDRKPIIEFALKYRLPTIWEWREQVEDGGLMAYGASLAWTAERVAAKVDRIFKGDKPGELPIEQPGKLGLAVNLKTAKAIGLTFPQALMARADDVIR
jgi:putative ABC transport system substrate-binding protein